MLDTEQEIHTEKERTEENINGTIYWLTWAIQSPKEYTTPLIYILAKTGLAIRAFS